ncbi:hypothetical protein BCR44DRAFT_1426436 [Catenaria anguillulae PL171]|uniref:HIT-type domain-containing protein n=1 Tax=Catenaria anguillulae PL171 TaxID=765915 RepID=A0A1Y2HXN1_9FUNG|nr:hypothetical protein BCR44DRAFT_1426436 [Catenaria anguillulae PL171]
MTSSNASAAMMQMPKCCQICSSRDRQAKYKCPRCAVAYCSITCYKSQSHASCVELFQAESLVASLKGRKADPDQSRQLHAILTKTYHQLQADQDDHSDEPDLASRLQGLELDSASPDEILARLTPAERKNFDDIVSRGELPSSLIDVIPLWTPWWLAAPRPTIVDLSDSESTSQPTMASDSTPLPPLPESIPPLPPAHHINPSLALNLPDVLLAYATTLRYMDGDLFADPFASAAILGDLSTILSARPELATFTYPDVDTFIDLAVETAIRLPAYFMAVTRLPILLRDIVHLLLTPTHLMRALNELVQLFDLVATSAKAQLAVAMTPASQAAVKKQRRAAYLTAKKCEYYLMFVAWMTASGAEEIASGREQARMCRVQGREAEEAQVSGLREVVGSRREFLRRAASTAVVKRS